MKRRSVARSGRGGCGLALLAIPVLAASAPSSAETAILTSAADNTLIESASGAFSNGSGPAFFVGRTSQASGSRRRGLLRFDVAEALPPGAIVLDVELRLVLTPSNPPPAPIGLHRVLAAWGEGDSAASGGSGAPSAPGDATWIHTFYDDTFWTHPGGDFVAEASTTSEVGDAGAVAWGSTPEAVADVQRWLDFPEANHGWLLLGEENAPTTSKRFASREADDPASHPQLVMEYELPCAMLALPAAAHALCHAYCDALACEAPAPAASPRACARIAALYASRSGGAMLLCKRPKSEPYLLEDEMRIAPPEASEGAGG